MRAALGWLSRVLNALWSRRKELGGNLLNIYYTLEGNDVQDFLQRNSEGGSCELRDLRSLPILK